MLEQAIHLRKELLQEQAVLVQKHINKLNRLKGMGAIDQDSYNDCDAHFSSVLNTIHQNIAEVEFIIQPKLSRNDA